MLIESIHKEEINATYLNAMLILGNVTIEDELKSRYSVTNIICEKDCKKYCTYLYLYAISSWCTDNDAFNFISEQELINIINKVQ